MDAEQFDALVRSLSSPASRRRVLSALASGPLGLFALDGVERADAKRRKKKRKKKKKPSGTTSPPPPSCVPNCTGKDCGDDGCGGSCGPCTGGSCQGDGVCICPQDKCGGACVAACEPSRVRNPDTCGCCAPTGAGCIDSSECCSDGCLDTCEGRTGGRECTFDAQCENNACQAGKCRCDGEICGGRCYAPCGSTGARNPATCKCCLRNGQPCASSSGCCSASCSSGNCVGKGGGAACTFDAQCASGNCRDFGTGDGTCESPPVIG